MPIDGSEGQIKHATNTKMAIILSKVITIIIITMTFGKFCLSQQVDTENMLSRVKRWQKGTNAYLHRYSASNFCFNKGLCKE